MNDSVERLSENITASNWKCQNLHVKIPGLRITFKYTCFI